MRRVFFAPLAFLVTAYYSFVAIYIGLASRSREYRDASIARWARTILKVGRIPVEVEGMSNIHRGTAYVVTANHQSLMDLPVLLGNIPLSFTILTKKELFRIPVFGWGMRGIGFLSVDRKNHTRAMKTLKFAEEKIVKEELSLLAFPEGTRTRDGEVIRFKKGSLVLAVKTGLPILPISIRGNFEILPRKTLLLQPGNVRVKIHPAISTDGLTHHDVTDLAIRVRDVVASGVH